MQHDGEESIIACTRSRERTAEVGVGGGDVRSFLKCRQSIATNK